jgi:hypothetical protein
MAEKQSPTYYSASDDIWLNALSKLSTHADVKKLTSDLGTSSELGDWGEFQGALHSLDFKVWNNKGIELGFSNMHSKILTKISFYNDSEIFGDAKNLPFSLSFSDTPEIIRARYKGHILEDGSGDFEVHVLPDTHPYITMKINMTRGKVGHRVSLYYDEYLAYMKNPSPHNLEDEPYMCDAFTAMINDVDNKFFNFRGKKTEELFPTWESNVVLDTYEVAETKVRREYILMEAYEGPDHDTAAIAFDSLSSYFDGCIEDEDLPYTWVKTEEQTEDAFKITLVTNEKNIKVEHHFTEEVNKYSLEKNLVYTAKTILKYSDEK